jgi:hypothetical protein
MYLKMTIERTERFTLRLQSSVFGKAVGGGNWAYLEIHFDAMIEQVSRCTLRP